MGSRFLTIVLYLVMLASSIAAQPQDLPAITPEEVGNLAIFHRILSEDFGVPDAEIMEFAFHPDNRQLAVVMQGAPYQRNVLMGLYDLEQNAVVALIENQTFRSTGYPVTGLHFSPDASLLVSTSEEGFIVWDIVEHESLFGGSPTGLPIITSDNRYLIILTEQVAHIWNLQQQREVDRRQLSCFRSMAIRRDAFECQRFAGNTFLVEIFELPSFDLIHTYEEEINWNYITSAISPDGRLMTRFLPRFIDGQDVYFYEIIDRETLSVLERVLSDMRWYSVIYTTNNSGRLIAYLTDQRYVILHDPITNTDLLTLFQPRFTYQWYVYHFDLIDRYFGLLSWPSGVLEIYGVADCYVTTEREINLRRGPGTEFDTPTTMQAGERLAVVGHSPQGNPRWLNLAIGLWVREDVVTVQGNC